MLSGQVVRHSTVNRDIRRFESYLSSVMAHNWKKNSSDDVDMWAMDQFGSSHHGPHCDTCGLEFCIECNPEYLSSDCSWFMN